MSSETPREQPPRESGEELSEATVVKWARELVRRYDRGFGQESLRQRLDEAIADCSEAQRALADAEERALSAEQDAEQALASYSRLSKRRSVQAALALARVMRPVFELRRRWQQPVRSSGRRDPVAERERIAKVLEARNPPAVTNGPMVSIIVLTRDGRHHLERLLPHLRELSYENVELIVVDNASSDGTDTLLDEAELPYPLRTIRNKQNVSFSYGNNQAESTANGELLLFLNNDIEPILPNWLGVMVHALESATDRVAVGAVLAYPNMGGPLDFTIQHSGIRLLLTRDRSPHAENMHGEDPVAPSLSGVYDVEAATAAALLVRRDAFVRVGRFDTGYVYGSEDVDLCLRLRAVGTIAIAGDAVLYHHESASQKLLDSTLTKVNRKRNWQRFAEKWGPAFVRSMQRNAVSTPQPARRRRPVVALALTRDDESAGYRDYYIAHELGGAFEREGWIAVYADNRGGAWYKLERTDLLISLTDSYDVRKAGAGAVTIAWIHGSIRRWIERPWFENYDVVVTGSSPAAASISESTRFDPEVIPLATNASHFVPGRQLLSFDCDYAFAGHYWGSHRELLDLLYVRSSERFILAGKGWLGARRFARYWQGRVGYGLLPAVYASADVILDDTSRQERTLGLVNSRVFDALASGTVVLTDNVAGSAELFGGDLPTYSSREELRSQLDRYLNDGELRRETAAKLRNRVLNQFTYDRLPTRFVASARDEIERPKVAIKICAPDRTRLEYWGDAHFAGGLARALRNKGFSSRIHVMQEWDLTDNQGFDVVIHLRGLTPYTPKPAQFNVLWVISHPADFLPGECDDYDLVLAASEAFANKLAAGTATPVIYLPQATDSRRFKPTEPDPELAEDVLFVGSTRRAFRPAVAWAIERGLPLAVYGEGWEDRLPSSSLRGTHFPNSRLGDLYASAGLVLNDHWDDMAENGFVSNRIFDVLGAGGVVVSDRVSELDSLFGDIVPTFGDSEELESVVRALLADDDRRRDLAARGARLVAEKHTFDNRATELAPLLFGGLKGRLRDLSGSRWD